MAKIGQDGNITSACSGVPSGQHVGGGGGEVDQVWARWLHNPCLLGGPLSTGKNQKWPKSGHTGGFECSPQPHGTSPTNYLWRNEREKWDPCMVSSSAERTMGVQLCMCLHGYNSSSPHYKSGNPNALDFTKYCRGVRHIWDSLTTNGLVLCARTAYNLVTISDSLEP